jgi:hypothetical protein
MAVVAVALAFVPSVPGVAAAATGGSISDPVGDVTQFAPDIGETAVTVGDDDTFGVDTRIVPTPPAGWGGCSYYVVGICVPSNMNVTWYLDFLPGAGSVADDGADAKVLAVPARDQTTWESSRWDAANGRFTAGAAPAASVDGGGVRWTLRLGDLGIPRPANVRMRIVSLYKSYTGTGVLVDYSDTAGPGTIPVGGPAGGTGPATGCATASRTTNRLQARIRSTTRRARHGSRSAKRRLPRLKAKRRRALRRLRAACGTPVKGPSPTAAPPGCRLVTKPVLVLEGVGLNARYVLRQRVVVECSR